MSYEDRPNEYGSSMTGDPIYDAALSAWKAKVERNGGVITWRDELNFVVGWKSAREVYS